MDGDHNGYGTLQDEVSILRRQLVEARREVQQLRAERDQWLAWYSQAQNEATLQAERLRFEHGPVVIMSWDEREGWPVCYVSPNVDQFGYTVDDFLSGRVRYLDIVHPDDLARVLVEIQHIRAVQAPPLTRQEYRIVCADGSIRHIADFSRPVYDEAGAIQRIDGYLLNVTGEKQAFAQLQQALDLTRATFESATGGVLITNLDGHLLDFNQRFLDIWQMDDRWRHTADLRERVSLLLDQVCDPDDFLRRIEELVAQSEGESYDVIAMRDGRSFSRHSRPFRVAGRIIGRLWSYYDITSAVRVEEQLRFQSQILETIGQAVIATTLDGTVTYWNHAAEQTYGWPQQAALGRNVLDLTLGKPVSARAGEIIERIGRGERWTDEFLARHRDGRTFSAEVTDVPFVNADGEIIGIIGISTDISVRKRAEETARKSQALLQGIIEYAPLIIYIKDTAGRYVQISPASLERLGYTREEFIGKTDAELFAPDVHAAWRMTDQEVLDSGRPMEFEVAIPMADGLNYFLASKFPIFDDQGTICALGGLAINITGQKNLAAALRESEERYNRATTVGAVGVWDWDLATNGMYLSPNLKAMLGYADYEIRNHLDDWSRYVHADDQAALSQAITAHLNGETDGFQLEHRMLHRDGSLRWIAARGMLIRDANGRPMRMVGTDTDITPLKQIAQALQRQQRFLRQIIDSSPAFIFTRDRNGCFTMVNRTMAALYGRSVEEMLGKTDADLGLDPAKVAQIQAQDQQIFAGFSEMIIPEGQVIDAAGQVHYITLVKRPLYSENGVIEQVLVVANDITERRIAELQLRCANQQLVAGNERLAQRNHEIMLLNHMSDLLLGCRSIDEAYEIISISAQQLFAGQPGALYLRRIGSDCYDVASSWGEHPPAEPFLQTWNCQVLHTQQPFMCLTSTSTRCSHIDPHEVAVVLCIPLFIEGDTLGILHLRHSEHLDAEELQRWRQLGASMAHQVTLALNNLILREQLQQQAIRDGLTGLYNRRYLDATLPRELQRVVRQQQAIGVIMLDIDHFKHFNDSYGHDAGDALLRAVGAFLSANTRGEDIACRYGGEEFILVLPGAVRVDTQQRAEAIRIGIQKLQLEHHGQPLETITVSLGVAVLAEPAATVSADMLIRQADQALYQAKRTGRNRVVVSG
jgi:diguanylate cyclase (GGDEF)-like protein/PAS domain S-box-containing protein